MFSGIIQTLAIALAVFSLCFIMLVFASRVGHDDIDN